MEREGAASSTAARPTGSTGSTGSSTLSTGRSAAAGRPGAVSDVYQWPVALALLPPLLSLYWGGSVQAWNEYFMLLVVAFYLYALVKVPWELYETCRVRAHRKLMASAQPPTATSHSNSNSTSIANTVNANAAVRQLKTLEYGALVLVFVSPLGGAVFLSYVRPHLLIHPELINDFPMALYILTAYIRPLIHIVRCTKRYAAQLHSDTQSSRHSHTTTATHYTTATTTSSKDVLQSSAVQHTRSHDSPLQDASLLSVESIHLLRAQLKHLSHRIDALAASIPTTSNTSNTSTNDADPFLSLPSTSGPIDALRKDLQKLSKKYTALASIQTKHSHQLALHADHIASLSASMVADPSRTSSPDPSSTSHTSHSTVDRRPSISLHNVGSLLWLPVRLSLSLMTWWVPQRVKRPISKAIGYQPS